MNLQEIISEQTKILADFRQYLLDDGKADRTVQSYVTDVFHFMSHVTEANPKRLSELTRQDVTRFRSHMVEKDFKPATVNKAINSLSCFCQWLQATGLHLEGQRLVDPKRARGQGLPPVDLAPGVVPPHNARGKASHPVSLPPGSYPHTIYTQFNRTMEMVKKRVFRFVEGLFCCSPPVLGSEKASEVRLRGSSFPPKGDWYCARISLVKGNAGGLKPLEGT